MPILPSRRTLLALAALALPLPCVASGADLVAERKESQQAQRRLETEFVASGGEERRGAIESLTHGGAYASLDFPDKLKMLAGKLGPGGRDAALARLEGLKDQMTTPAASAALGEAYLSLGEAASAKELAESILRTAKFDPEMLSPGLQADAHALKGFALNAEKDPSGAAAEGDLALRLNSRHRGALSLSKLSGRGTRPDSATGGPPLGGAPPLRLGGDPRPGGDRRPRQDAARAFVRRLESAFGMRDRSGTLDGTIRRAGKGNVVSFADLERAGIKFEEGGAGQKDAVEVREEEGRVVVSVSPSVLKSARDARVAAQFGRGLEEAAVERDYDGIGEFIRKVGGRIKAVRILIELDAGDNAPAAGDGEADMNLLADRAVVEASKTNSISRFFPENVWQRIMDVLKGGKLSGDVSAVGVMIESVKVDPNTPAPSSRSAQEDGYLTNLRK